MSRAFTKERDDAPAGDAVPKRTSPLALTPPSLRRRLAELAAEPDDTLRQQAEAELREATLVESPADRSVVAPGATVRLRGATRGTSVFEIVTEDDVDVEQGRVGERSPLGEALAGRRAGDRVIWPRPAGDRNITIIGVEYDSSR